MEVLRLKKISSAIFYALSSFMIMVVNKQVLTVYNYPSFQILGSCQMLATVTILGLGGMFKFIEIPKFDGSIPSKLFPLPLFYMGNMMFGLGGTKALSLPMVTVLRRFSIFMTLVAEYVFLDAKPSLPIQLSVFMMILGAVFAAVNDLSFSMLGFFYLLMNNVCTVGMNITMKKKLISKSLGKYGILFYNSLFMLIPSFLLPYHTGDFALTRTFEGWSNPYFVLCFSLSTVFGFVLMLATMMCTHYNSPLTTSMIGSIKNIAVTYIGMFIGGDYIFSVGNFLGLNICVVGTVIYAYVTFAPKTDSEPSTLLQDVNRPTDKVESVAICTS